MVRVAVLGGGPSGLVSLKECVEAGLEAVAFEKTHSLGGVWSHGTWGHMRANLSRASCVSHCQHLACCYVWRTCALFLRGGCGDAQMFSDFPWPPSADEFPTATAMQHYLEAYADHFHLKPRIRFGVDVAVERWKGGRWIVRYRSVELDCLAGEGIFTPVAHPRLHLQRSYPMLPQLRPSYPMPSLTMTSSTCWW